MDIMKALSRNIKTLRNQRSISQYKLAEISGVHRSTIAHLELCYKDDVSLRTVSKIATGLNVDPTLLLYKGMDD